MEGSRDSLCSQTLYCFSVEEDSKTFGEVMKSHDSTFRKEAVKYEMDSIIGNNTWVLANLPPGYTPLGCKWIFKRKIRINGTIEKYNDRLLSIALNKLMVLITLINRLPMA